MRRPNIRSRRSGPRLAPRAFLLALVTTVGLLGSCEDPVVLGVRAHELRDLLRSGDGSVLISVPVTRLRELARLGPGALYYGARAVGLLGDEERELALLRLAADKENGIFRRRSRELLSDLLYERGNWAELLALSDGRFSTNPDAYPMKRRRTEALVGLGRYAEAREEIDRLTAEYPEESERDAGLLAVLRFRSTQSPEERANEIRALFALPSARAEDLAVAWDAVQENDQTRFFGESDLALFRMRVNVARKDYGAAYRALSAYPGNLISVETPRVFLADAGKTYLYAPALRAGLTAMKALEASTEENASAETSDVRHLALFYKARMLRQAERYADAAEGFLEAYTTARTSEELDASAWYRADSLAATDRKAAADWLARSAPNWRDPASFADIVERLARESLLARNGAVLYTLRTDVSPYMTPRAAFRLVYLAGRAAQTGIAAPPENLAPDRKEYARRAFEEVLARSPEPYYRLLAAHRLGLPLLRLPSSRPLEPRIGLSVSERSDVSDPETYLMGFLEFGSGGLVPAEIRALEKSAERLDSETLRRVSTYLRDSGEYAASMLVVNRLLESPDYEPAREDWELFWPRPWREEVADSATAYGMDENLLYGLIRSESFFRPAVVSHAGAVGLAQLMPSTAEEVAARLRMDSYDLTDPEDNIRLGSAHFGGLLRTLKGRVLPSVFAYNAGLSRVRGWEKAARGFPDDLLLESLSIEETREYGRNVLWASIVYDLLYYGSDEEAMLKKMLGE